MTYKHMKRWKSQTIKNTLKRASLGKRNTTNRARALKPDDYKSSFFSSSLPQLPETPTDLEKFLESLPRHKRTNPQRPKYIKQRNTQVNAFMAFRAYHSRGILKPKTQKDLSAVLADFWAKEASQLTWQRYATEYTNTKENISFVGWLQRELNLQDDFPEQERDEPISNLISVDHLSNNCENRPIIAPGTTEDIFLPISERIMAEENEETFLFEFDSLSEKDSPVSTYSAHDDQSFFIYERYSDSTNYFISGV